jgi:hypothetical protein
MLKDMDFDIERLEKDVKISARALSEYLVGNGDPTTLLYQTGYLTIKSYHAKTNFYTLGFPNEEVKYGFLYMLLPAYMPKTKALTEFFVWNFIDDLQAGNVESFMTRLKAFFADNSYELENKTEKHYQTVLYLLFKLMGQFVKVEPRSALGRADVVVVTANTVYVFELKITGKGTAESAIKQIDDKGYTIPYSAGKKKVVKIGAEFSTEQRGLKKWLVISD